VSAGRQLRSELGTFTVLREPQPVRSKNHQCVVKRGERGSAKVNQVVIECNCGKRYVCRRSLWVKNRWVWVRHTAPRPRNPFLYDDRSI
jgi:hypothetical protein